MIEKYNAPSLFGFYLTRNSTKGSTLTLGGTDTSKYVGAISYTPVTVQGYWQVATSVLVNGTVAGVAQGAIDSATTFIYYPTAVAAKIYAAIPGASSDTVDDAFVGGSADYYQYPCRNKFTVSLSFDGLPGQSFNISSADFNIGVSSSDSKQCIGAIIGMDINDPKGNPVAIVGGSFMKNWYTTFNFNVSGNPAVGFATLNPTLMSTTN